MSEFKSYWLEDLQVGMTETFTKIVSAEDIDAFAHVTGDRNPIHLDQAYAETTFFKDRIAHGMLTASFISAVLGTQLPGPGCVYLSQSLKFRAPVKIGDEVTARVTVADVDQEKRRNSPGNGMCGRRDRGDRRRGSADGPNAAPSRRRRPSRTPRRGHLR